MNALPLPPISQIEIAAPGQSGRSPTVATIPEVLDADTNPTHGVVVEPNGWEAFVEYAFGCFGFSEDEFTIHLRYERHSREDITADLWLSQPERFQFVGDRDDRGRCVRIYAFFRSRPREDAIAAPPANAERLRLPWWSSRVWNQVPLSGEIAEGEVFPGSGSRWVAGTGVTPPWLLAHTRPPLTSVLPRLPHAPQPKSRFLDVPREIRDPVYCLLLDLGCFEETVGKMVNWRQDRYLRQTPSILLVCHQVFEEAEEILHTRRLRLCRGVRPTTFARELTHLISPGLVCNLRFITLAWTIPPAGQNDARGRLQFLITASDVIGLWIMQLERNPAEDARSLRIEVQIGEDEIDGIRRDMAQLRPFWAVASHCARLMEVATELVEVSVGDTVWEYGSLWEERMQRQLD